MILVTVGSQKFQFNRLLKKIDELIEDGIINETVYAQIGVSDYKPKNYDYVDFMTQEEFNNKIKDSSIVITHAGTGVIVNSLKMGKKVVGVPRFAKYGEHVDDHQIQLIKEFEELNLIEPSYEIKSLDNAIKKVKRTEYEKYISNTDSIVKSIEEYISV